MKRFVITALFIGIVSGCAGAAPTPSPSGKQSASAAPSTTEPSSSAVASSSLEPGISADQWFLDYCAVEATPCDGTEPKVPASLDGHAGWLVPSSDPQAYFGIGDRIYLVVIWQPEDHPALESYGGGRKLVEAFLSTMQLLPG